MIYVSIISVLYFYSFISFLMLIRYLTESSCKNATIVLILNSNIAVAFFRRSFLLSFCRVQWFHLPYPEVLKRRGVVVAFSYLVSWSCTFSSPLLVQWRMHLSGIVLCSASWGLGRNTLTSINFTANGYQRFLALTSDLASPLHVSWVWVSLFIGCTTGLVYITDVFGSQYIYCYMF